MARAIDNAFGISVAARPPAPWIRSPERRRRRIQLGLCAELPFERLRQSSATAPTATALCATTQTASVHVLTAQHCSLSRVPSVQKRRGYKRPLPGLQGCTRCAALAGTQLEGTSRLRPKKPPTLSIERQEESQEAEGRGRRRLLRGWFWRANSTVELSRRPTSSPLPKPSRRRNDQKPSADEEKAASRRRGRA